MEVKSKWQPRTLALKELLHRMVLGHWPSAGLLDRLHATIGEVPMERNIWTTHAIVAASRASDHWRRFLTTELQRIADHSAYEYAKVSRRAWLSFAYEEMQQGTR
eukprot:6428293-Amphidinium_carterae.1